MVTAVKFYDESRLMRSLECLDAFTRINKILKYTGVRIGNPGIGPRFTRLYR